MKKTSILGLLFYLVSFGVFSQINSRVKSIYFENADSVTVRANATACGDCGFIYYNNDDTTNAKFRIYQDSIWYDLINHTTVSPNTILGTLVPGRLPYPNGTHSLYTSNKLLWDTTNYTLTLNELDIFSYGSIGGTASNLFIGYNPGNFTNSGAFRNYGIGGNTLLSLTSGDDNNVFGTESGYSITTGSSNVLHGEVSGNEITTGSNNIGLGNNALDLLVSGNDNIGIGRGSKSGTTGSNNISIGQSSGAITTGSNNVVIGTSSNPLGLSGSNQLSIQNAIYGLNNSGTTNTISTGNIGIYTRNPDYNLEVTGHTANDSLFAVSENGGLKALDIREVAGVINSTITNGLSGGGIYTNDSTLISKGYADSHYAGTTYTFSSGLTESGGGVKVGGTLLNNTGIETDGYIFEIDNSDTPGDEYGFYVSDTGDPNCALCFYDSGTKGIKLDADNIGLYGVTVTPQYATGATLTNNITSGGTSNATTDFTSLTVYATDAQAIRDSMYQMAEKIRKLEEALKLLGVCID